MDFFTAKLETLHSQLFQRNAALDEATDPDYTRKHDLLLSDLRTTQQAINDRKKVVFISMSDMVASPTIVHKLNLWYCYKWIDIVNFRFDGVEIISTKKSNDDGIAARVLDPTPLLPNAGVVDDASASFLSLDLCETDELSWYRYEHRLFIEHANGTNTEIYITNLISALWRFEVIPSSSPNLCVSLTPYPGIRDKFVPGNAPLPSTDDFAALSRYYLRGFEYFVRDLNISCYPCLNEKFITA